ncbi:MAG: hypothetical protein OJF50_000787 [Nitrospira sp.]|nr:hypothetical protein [Nitrospira sp.]
MCRGVICVQAAYEKNFKPRVTPMNSIVREVLQRLPKKIEWVFTKANGTRILPSGDFLKRARQQAQRRDPGYRSVCRDAPRTIRLAPDRASLVNG